MTISPEKLSAKADFIRRDMFETAMRGKAGHIAPSLSCVDILVALYYQVMNGDDHFILSKAHGCYAYYSILADLGKLPKEEWKNFYGTSRLPGCAERIPEWGIEAGCGALGHGLPLAAGWAWAKKLSGESGRIFCLVGDGEMQEGSNYEALQLAAFQKLDNLFLIIDGNRLQAMEPLEKVLCPEDQERDFRAKMIAFGCEYHVCDGHDALKISEVISGAGGRGKPVALYAKTVKGYGLKAIENKAQFHFRLPNEDEINGGWR